MRRTTSVINSTQTPFLPNAESRYGARTIRGIPKLARDLPARKGALAQPNITLATRAIPHFALVGDSLRISRGTPGAPRQMFDNVVESCDVARRGKRLGRRLVDRPVTAAERDLTTRLEAKDK